MYTTTTLIKVEYFLFSSKFFSGILRQPFSPIFSLRLPLTDLISHITGWLPIVEFHKLSVMAGFFFSAECFQYSFMMLHVSVLYVSEVQAFSFLTRISWWEYSTICKPIHLLMDIWIVSNFWLLWLMLLWTLMYNIRLSPCFQFFGYISGSGCVDHTIILCLTLKFLSKCLWLSTFCSYCFSDPFILF